MTSMFASPRLRTSLVALALGAATNALAQEQPAPPASRADSIPVVLTVSGAISLGSYQGGVHWSLLEFLRKSRDDEGFAQRVGTVAATGDGEFRVPSYKLATATGASAGNINSLLSALEWCRASELDDQEPEESLFWKTWIPTGWEQLFPGDDLAGRETNLALFDRRYFRRVHEPMLADWLATTATRGDCRVPVGITLTRLVPDSVRLNRAGTVTAATQRFASAVLLETDSLRGDRAFFMQPPADLWSSQALGRLIRMQSAEGTNRISPKTVVRLAEASSAYPLAFEPVELTYEDPQTCQYNSTRCGAFPAIFIDGGVFDNNPLDLAYGLFERLGGVQHPRTRVVYIDPDQLRGQLAENRNSLRQNQPVASRGIGAILQLASGVVPSAQQYELQSLARTLARDPFGEMRAGWLKVTDRSYPVVGEHLGHFAAFFGRPFREYDFYVGMYDGLRFAAAEFVCTEAPRDTTLSSEQRASVLWNCTSRVLDEFINGGLLPLGPMAPRVLRALYEAEYGPMLTYEALPQLDGLNARRAVLIDGLVRANGKLIDFTGQECKTRPFEERLFCAGGFDAMLRWFTADPTVLETVKDLADPEQCSWDRWWAADTVPCIADGTLVRLLKDRRAFSIRMFEQLLHQLWRIEDRITWDRSDGMYSARDYEAYAEGISILYRSAAVLYPTRRGLDVDPSTVPAIGTRGAFLAGNLLPYYLGTNIEAGGLDLIWSRPTFHWNESLAFTWSYILNYRPGTLDRSAESAQGYAQWFASIAPGILWKRQSVLFSGIEIRPVEPLIGFADDRRRQVHYTSSLAGYFVGNKIRFGVRYVPDPIEGVQQGNRFGYTLGISDFNGLTYWVLRALRN